MNAVVQTSPPTSTAPRSDALADVLQHPAIWRQAARSHAIRSHATHNARLDALLPGGGWPRGALTEILVGQDGLGELQLLLPTLAALTRQRQRVVFIAPPYIPYPPALVAAGIALDQLLQIDAGAADRHWSAEQCLRAGCSAAVVQWLPDTDYRHLRRLQLAAETGDSMGFVFRPLHDARQHSPAALRLTLSKDETSIRLRVLKCRGGVAGGQLEWQHIQR